MSNGEMMGSILGPKRVITKDIKSCTYYCYDNSMSLEKFLGPKQAQLITMPS